MQICQPQRFNSLNHTQKTFYEIGSKLVGFKKIGGGVSFFYLALWLLNAQGFFFPNRRAGNVQTYMEIYLELMFPSHHLNPEAAPFIES